MCYNPHSLPLSEGRSIHHPFEEPSENPIFSTRHSPDSDSNIFSYNHSHRARRMQTLSRSHVNSEYVVAKCLRSGLLSHLINTDRAIRDPQVTEKTSHLLPVCYSWTYFACCSCCLINLIRACHKSCRWKCSRFSLDKRCKQQGKTPRV